jgi:hypothetical protein
LKLGRFEPSSKICNVCGSINNGLKLSDREWICAGGGTLHDRDINASINIKKFALQDQNLIGVIAPTDSRGEHGGNVVNRRIDESGSPVTCIGVDVTTAATLIPRIQSPMS